LFVEPHPQPVRILADTCSNGRGVFPNATCKDRISSPPRAATSDPSSRPTRHTNRSIASATCGESLASRSRISELIPETKSAPRQVIQSVRHTIDIHMLLAKPGRG
jgi:hypothetical protein